MLPLLPVAHSPAIDLAQDSNENNAGQTRFRHLELHTAAIARQLGAGLD
jgi:hypothetical protein